MNSKRIERLELADFWTWSGTVGRAKYAGIGVFMFALKHLIDRIVAASFGYAFSIFDYLIVTDDGVQTISQARAEFFATLVLVALPFIWIGVVLTLRRLRDANLPLWLVALFFVPFLNLFFFLLLTILPSAIAKTSPDETEQPGFLSRVMPTTEIGSGAMGVLITVLLGLIFTLLSVNILDHYGWGLFIGIPFFLGLNSVLIYGYHAPRPLLKCLMVAFISVLLLAAALFVIAFEGLICLVMAAPLAIVLAVFGGMIGYCAQSRYTFRAESFQVFALLILVFPGVILLEKASQPQSPLYAVRTSVVVDAPPEKVWENVIAFEDLPPPNDKLFKTGIAYPLRAQINGSGVGAVRHCVFSTGEFVEPISVWERPKLLRFDVTSQPPVMKEWSMYDNVAPRHLEHYLVSRQGQFLLVPLSDGRTLLEGTTWYDNRMWPGRYWRLWSDLIIHRIHNRVLVHIKNLSEHRSTGNTFTK